MRSLAAALCLATAGVAAAACGTAGERSPATPAAAPASAPEAAAAVPDNDSAAAVLPAPRVAQPQPAPAPAPPTEPAAAEKPPRKPRPPEPEIEIQWGKFDDTIPTPDDIHPDRVLAKFRAPDGAVIVVYRRARDGQLIRRRIRGLGTSGMKMVEEKFLEEGPPPAAP